MDSTNKQTTPATTRPDSHAPALAACAPVLPSGYESQPAWTFSDGSGQGSYEFHRVYAPAKPQPGRPSVVISMLDQERSYWGVTWTVHGQGGATHPAASWISFGDARKKKSSLTFSDFSSATHMREDLAALRR
jgi:hypothetical protein